jgi:hydrogenase maturation protease
MVKTKARILVFGYGNPGRLDDGLGVAFAQALSDQQLPSVDVETNYQLNIEDAAKAAEYELVLFVDAAVKGVEPFFVNQVIPEGSLTYTSHSLDPEHVMALAKQLFGASALAFAIGIRGYKYDAFGEKLSLKAKANLEAAFGFLTPLLRKRDRSEIIATLEYYSSEAFKCGENDARGQAFNTVS